MASILFRLFGWAPALGLGLGYLTFYEGGHTDIWMRLAGVGIGGLWLLPIATWWARQRADRYPAALAMRDDQPHVGQSRSIPPVEQ